MDNSKQERRLRWLHPVARRHGEHGFSMVEVLMVMAMIAILTGMVYPNLTVALRGMQLRTAADIVKNQLLVARLRAVSNATVPCGVYFDMSNGKTLVFFDNGATSKYQYNAAEDQLYSSVVALPRGFAFVTTATPLTSNCVVFRGDGSAKAGGSIRIRDPKGRVRQIDILASTGRVKVVIPGS